LQATNRKGFKTFFIIWIGQLVSLTGSGLTGFALGVWVFQNTHSVTQFALIGVFTSIPGIIMSPIAGALVDRWDRRTAMILSDAGAGACTLITAILLYASILEVWHIYILMAVSSAFSSFQWPAYSASITMLVPKEQLGRASGLVQVAEAVAQIIAPILAGVLVGVIGVEGVITIDVATMTFAVITLLFIRIPKPPVTIEGTESRGSIWREAVFGWKYIVARKGLMGLLVMFAANNFTGGMVGILFTPLVLTYYTPAVYGSISSIGGIGFLLGSLLMSIWGGTRRKIMGIFIFEFIMGIGMFFTGFQPGFWLYAVTIFIVFFSMPLSSGSSQALWQRKVAPDLQGRVFSVRRMIAWSLTPVSYLIAGPLADHLFEPGMQENGALSGIFGTWLGVGDGRGIGLMMVIMGVITMVVVIAGIFYKPLRRVDIDLPDAMPDPEPPAGS